MRPLMTASFGITLLASAIALTGAPASALEPPAVFSKAQSDVTKVDEREGREHRERCERIRRECRERHGDHHREYRECVERERC